jgi:2'-5' RNA ligase
MDYNKLSLVELKNICKSKNLQYGGTKNQLIKRITDSEKPIPVTINEHKGFNLPKDKKIVGVKMGDTEKLMRVSKEIEKKTARRMYYSMDVFYYMVDKEFSFD